MQLLVQICYAAKTWYGDLIGMMIFGVSEVSGNVDLGEETRTMVCKFVLRSSSGTLVDEITADVQNWLDDLTDCAVRVVSDAEVQVSGLYTALNFLHVMRQALFLSCWISARLPVSLKVLFRSVHTTTLLCTSPGLQFLNGVILPYYEFACHRLQLKRN